MVWVRKGVRREGNSLEEGTRNGRSLHFKVSRLLPRIFLAITAYNLPSLVLYVDGRTNWWKEGILFYWILCRIPFYFFFRSFNNFIKLLLISFSIPPRTTWPICWFIIVFVYHIFDIDSRLEHLFMYWFECSYRVSSEKLHSILIF